MVTKTKAAAAVHVARVLDALEEIKDQAEKRGDLVGDPTWAVVADALAETREALIALGVPAENVFDYPERLPRG